MFLQLNNITLICVDGVGKSELPLKAIRASTSNIQYEKVLLITADKSIQSDEIIEVKHIDKITWNEYNEFVLSKLTEYFNTDYVLLIQEDGYVSNHLKWTDEFLNYDYIGAPWPIDLIELMLTNLSKQKNTYGQPFKKNIPIIKDYNPNNYRIGNGGFSLRSKKLCNFTKKYSQKYPDAPEDCVISIYEKEDIINNKLRIAPFEIGARFSVESVNELNLKGDINQTFGFHKPPRFFPNK
jgi:hypothetical protein